MFNKKIFKIPILFILLLSLFIPTSVFADLPDDTGGDSAKTVKIRKITTRTFRLDYDWRNSNTYGSYKAEVENADGQTLDVRVYCTQPG